MKTTTKEARTITITDDFGDDREITINDECRYEMIIFLKNKDYNINTLWWSNKKGETMMTNSTLWDYLVNSSLSPYKKELKKISKKYDK